MEERIFECGFSVEQVKDAFPDIPEERIVKFMECNDEEICERMDAVGWNFIVNNIRCEEFYD